jgi:hypothetical protein
VIDRDELSSLREEERHVPVATKTAIDGLDDMAGKGGSNDGVDGVSALLEHPSTGFGLLDVTARDDATI